MSGPQPSRQLWLALAGPAQHVAVLHGGHRQRIAICTKSEDAWQERVLRHADAGAVAAGLVAGSDLNVYQSQNGFRGERRKSNEVAALTGIFVDVDHYTVPALAGLAPDALLDRVLAAHPWLPVPTMVIGSGRGVYLSWLFREPLGADQLDRWQAVENVMVDLLAPFGADSHAKDAARVLRVVGSVNAKSGELVEGVFDTGRAIAFAHIERAVLRYGREELRTRALAAVEPQPEDVRQATVAQKAQFLRPYTLAKDRMADCHTLAALRGLPMRDYRARLAFVFAASVAWFCSDVEQVAGEVEAFAADHFADGERYGKRHVGSVLERLQHDRQGIVRLRRLKDGMVQTPNRYRLTNATIIRLLNITDAEQRSLKTIVGKDERQRRRTERRRAAGMVDRETYRASAAEQRTKRRQMVCTMRQQGMSQRAIAASLGMSPALVSMILAGQR